MSDEEILSKDEIDALVTGVDSGGIDTNSPAVSGEVVDYDIMNRERIVRGRMPTLEMLNKRFLRKFSVNMYMNFQTTFDIDIQEVSKVRFSELKDSLGIPTSINMVKMLPLKGLSFVLFDLDIIYSLVEKNYGGSGRKSTSQAEKKTFTPTEKRMINKLLKIFFKDLEHAWSPVISLNCELNNYETNPQLVDILSPHEPLIIITVDVSFDGGKGQIKLAMPEEVLDPIREILDSGYRSEKHNIPEQWQKALKDKLYETKIEISSHLLDIPITLKKLISLKAGDIIPIEMPEHVTLYASGRATHTAKYGIHNNRCALKILKKH